MDALSRPRLRPPHHSASPTCRAPRWRCLPSRRRGIAGHSGASTTPFRHTGCRATAHLLICPQRLVCCCPVIVCRHPRRPVCLDAIPAHHRDVPGRHGGTGTLRSRPDVTCDEACLSLLRSGACRGTGGEREGEIAVERDGDRRVGASHPIIITLSNNNKKNLNSNDNDNHDTIITIALMQ